MAVPRVDSQIILLKVLYQDADGEHTWASHHGQAA